MVMYSSATSSSYTKPLLPVTNHEKQWHDMLRSLMLLVTCVALGVLGMWLLALATWPPEGPSSQVHVAINSYRPATAGMDDIVRVQATPVSLLVVYIYAANSDPECPDNLRFFIRTAVKENDGAHYIFAVQLVRILERV